MRKFKSCLPNLILNIDSLWAKYSNGLLGWSVQREIWENLLRKDSISTINIFEIFCERVNWLNKEGLFKEKNDLYYFKNIKQGQYPMLRFLSEYEDMGWAIIWENSVKQMFLKLNTIQKLDHL